MKYCNWLVLLLFCTSLVKAQEYNYGEVLQKSLFFYEAQQSGMLSPNNRVEWRNNSFLNDGQDVGLDLSGGWHDAGDHWKSNHTMSYTASFMAWSMLQYPEAYIELGQKDELFESLTHVTSYFLKCIVDSNPNDLNNFQNYDVYIDVGGKPGPDPEVHTIWTAPHIAEGFTVRESVKVNKDVSGPDITASMAAALSSSAMVYHTYGNASQKEYAVKLYNAAKKLLNFAETYPFTSTSIVNGKPQVLDPNGNVRTIGYRSPDPRDEILYAKLWLHRASKLLDGSYTDSYLQKAHQQIDELAQSVGLNDFFRNDRDLYPGNYQHAALLLLLQIDPSDPKNIETLFENHLKLWDDITPSPYGLKVRSVYGSLTFKWVFAQANLSIMYSDLTTDPAKKERYYTFAKSQLDYALGKNKQGKSFVIGFGDWINEPLHNSAHGWPFGFEGITEDHKYYHKQAQHVIYGGLMAGPDQNDNFVSVISKKDMNEVALDFNIGLQNVVASIVAKNPAQYPALPDSEFPQPEERNQSLNYIDTDREYFVNAQIVEETSSSIKIKASIHNHSSYPPTKRYDMSFKYYLRLDNGASPSDYNFTIHSSQGAIVSPIQQVDGQLYYYEVSFPNERIMPVRKYNASQKLNGEGLPDDIFRRNVEFTISANSAEKWDPDNDFSNKELDGNMLIRPNMPAYDNNVYLEGNEVNVESTPSSPTGFGFFFINDNIHLEWEKIIADDIYDYLIYKAENAGGPFVFQEFSKDSYFVDQNVEPGKTYYYQVKARNNHFNISNLSAVIEITAASSNMAAATTITNTTKCNATDGSIKVDNVTGASGTTFNYYINREPNPAGINSSLFSNLIVGNYIIRIVDENNNAYIDTVSINSDEIINADIQVVNQQTCNTDDGEIKATVTPNSNETYAYFLKGVEYPDGNFSGLSPGTYELKITSSTSCVLEKIIEVKEVPEISNFNAVIANPANCDESNGSIDVNSITGGTAPYAYYINDDENPTGINQQKFSGLAAGVFNIKIIDQHACTFNKDVILEDPQSPSLSVTTSGTNFCYTDSNVNIDLIISGGQAPYSVVWSDGLTTEDHKNSSVGKYAAKVTDQNNCIAFSDSIPVTAPDSISIVGEVIEEDQKFSILVQLSGGTGQLNYSWSNGVETQDLLNVESGIYEITVVDKNACFKSKKFYAGVVTSVEDGLTNQLITYPNPFTEKVYIKNLPLNQPIHIEVFDAQGKPLKASFYKDSNQYILHLDAYKAGLYFINVIYDNKSEIYKLLKK